MIALTNSLSAQTQNTAYDTSPLGWVWLMASPLSQHCLEESLRRCSLSRSACDPLLRALALRAQTSRTRALRTLALRTWRLWTQASWQQAPAPQAQPGQAPARSAASRLRLSLRYF